MPDPYDHSTVAIAELGNGEPLVMLHGWGRSGADLRPLAELLASVRRVILVDLPGFGNSPPPADSGWSSSDYAELVRQVLERRGVTSFELFGHSFGGRVAVTMSSRWPALVSKLILVGSHGLKRHRTPRQRLRLWAISRSGNLLKWADRRFGLKLYPEHFAKRFGSPDYQRAGVLKNTLVKLVTEDQTENARNIRCPTLLIWGEADTETPPEMARRFNQLITGSRLIILPGKGHDPYLGTGAHLCGSHILNFLKAAETRAAV